MAPLPWKSFSNLYCFILAVCLVGQLGLGEYMIRLTLYHPWYNAAPFIHKGLGLTIAVIAVARLGARLYGTGVPSFKVFFNSLRYNIYGIQHLLLYSIVLSTAAAGFAFATSSGDPAPFFGLFDVPSPITQSENTGEMFDSLHTILAWSLITLIALHSIEKMRILLRRRG